MVCQLDGGIILIRPHRKRAATWDTWLTALLATAATEATLAALLGAVL